ncbi:GTP cyclohydrolase II [Palleronia marisminoris]|uniref:GTP cyclohydrolase-2 n=1 Tax=Palleronia marisminoris TaxID=315423 RepID=A0A1Y5SKM8_9RHOB|nr:GTP cyclohydrolase II [Palleronia marisminoris]SFG87153.1 GTP cyclohydrolase II [Palleronia marisminoris]SLN43023.1 GTP cyclohydrolase-2 [Palleronia marisminoris]
MDALFPSLPELVSRARADLRIGLPIVVEDGQTRALVAAAEALSAPRLSAMVAHGTAELALTHRRAETLKIRLYDGDLVRLPLSPDLRPADLQAMIDPAGDLSTPMKGPFNARREGSATLARAGLALAKSARILPAVVVRPVAQAPAMLTRVPIDAIAPQTPARLASVINARLPIAATIDARLHIFRPNDGGEEHYAVEIGRPDRSNPVLARLHSACFTGDVLGSLKCDCGPQLNTALEAMAAAGSGILLYLNQEGRGIGLANKVRAYALQDQGFDTVEANHRLGFDDDERDFGLGAALLREMDVGQVRLMTNNPRKVAQLQAEGIDVVERVPLWVGETRFNRDYLRIKSEKSGHIT